MRFRDRTDAGRQLADRLKGLPIDDPVILALPRGGVPVAFQVASGLDAPMDVFVARKVGAPSQPEYGIGAVAEGGAVVSDSRALAAIGLSEQHFAQLVERERLELDRRVRAYRGERPLPEVGRRSAVLVDDGLATGVTAEAALLALRARQPRHLVLAVPVCASQTADRLRSVADDVVCVHAPSDFWAVGYWYEEFGQTTDGEVLDLLARRTRATATKP